MEALFVSMGEEIQDADEETFDVFSQSMPSRDLGMVNPSAPVLDLSIAGRDFEIVQSPGVLQSARDGGTTGAAVWQASVRLAEWFEWTKNPLLKHEVVSSTSVVMELGSGVSGVVPCVLAPKVRRMVSTDQAYILKTLRENIAANTSQPGSKRKRAVKSSGQQHQHDNVDVVALDWENDDVASWIRSNGLGSGIDLLVACDCVYNYALIAPLVQACAEICETRRPEPEQEYSPTVCVIAQQLRQPDVFQEWLETFRKRFRVWRVPSELLCECLREGSGFIVHLGILRR